MPGPPVTANLQRWYDASTLALNDGDPVSAWPDGSTNAVALAAAGAARPTFRTGRWNGLPGVVFNGSNVLQASSAVGRPAAAVTAFAVAALVPRNGYATVCQWGTTASTGFALFASTSTDASRPPASFACLRAGGTWGNNQAVSAQRPDAGEPLILSGQCPAAGSPTFVRVEANEDDDVAGDAGATIGYGAGPVLLSVGATPELLGYYTGEVFELLVYDAALSASDVASVEAYLDAKWRVTLAQAAYRGLFNGVYHDSLGNEQHYQLGLAWSPDGTRFRRGLADPVLSPTGAGWESAHLHAPSVVDLGGGNLIALYGGSNGSIWQTGRVTSSDGGQTWTRDPTNPVIPAGAAGSFDDGGAYFPVFLWDPAASLYRCWYTAVHAGAFAIAYAESRDSRTWIKKGVVLSAGSGWEAAGVVSGTVYRDDATARWHLYYTGFADSATQRPSQGGHASAANPGGPFVRDPANPLLVPGGAATTLGADLAAGGRVVTVVSTSGFAAGAAVMLWSSSGVPGTEELNRVASVDSPTQITLELPVVHAFPVANAAAIRAIGYLKLQMRTARLIASTLTVWGTTWGTYSDQANESTRELGVRWKAPGAGGPFTLVATAPSPLMWLREDSAAWDANSAENLGLALTGLASLGRLIAASPGGDYW